MPVKKTGSRTATVGEMVSVEEVTNIWEDDWNDRQIAYGRILRAKHRAVLQHSSPLKLQFARTAIAIVPLVLILAVFTGWIAFTRWARTTKSMVNDVAYGIPLTSTAAALLVTPTPISATMPVPLSGGLLSGPFAVQSTMTPTSFVTVFDQQGHATMIPYDVYYSTPTPAR